MDAEQKATKLAELQSSVNSMVDSNLYQAKLIQAMHKILIDAGIECGSKEIVAGMRCIESLKQQRDELLTYARHKTHCPKGIAGAPYICDCGFDEAIAKAVSNG